MTANTMEPRELVETDDLPVPTHDDAISSLVKSLINSVVKDSESAYGDTPREKLKNQIKQRSDDSMMNGITALSTYLLAQASNRQAAALESLSRTATRLQFHESDNAQAIVDSRESKRDYLATTYSLPPAELSLLWAMRGMLIDASIKSLSRPDRFDPYRRLTTEEISWSLRITPVLLYSGLPRNDEGDIDFALLEDFDIVYYDGTPEEPDGWMYNG